MRPCHNCQSNSTSLTSRCFHSALYCLQFKVFSNIIVSCNNGHYSALTLLDLAAALDTVDHDILITSLTAFGLKVPELNFLPLWSHTICLSIQCALCFVKQMSIQAIVLWPVVPVTNHPMTNFPIRKSPATIGDMWFSTKLIATQKRAGARMQPCRTPRDV